MDGALPSAVLLSALALALLLLRGAGCGLEAALAASGLAWAKELARSGKAPRRSRALLALLEDAERTAAALRALEVLTAVLAGFAAGAAGMRGLERAPAVGAWLGLVLCAFIALALAAAGRGVGVRHAGPVALALARSARRLAQALVPLAGAAGSTARALGVSAAGFAPPRPPLEELERALSEYARDEGNASDQSTSELIQAVFDFRDKVARDVMVPRTEVVAIDIETPVPEILQLLAEEGHSRLPVYRESLDKVVGTLHARDLVPMLAHPELIVLRDLIRPPHFVPWSKRVDQLLREMQRRHIHMAVVVDEHGGVMGICTLEDVLEQIVGELGDEFEVEDGKSVEGHPDGTFTVRADAEVAEFNRVTGAGLPEDAAYETVGGFLNALAGAIPVSGDRFFHGGWLFTVAEASPQRVLKVRAARVKRPAGA